MDNKKTCSACKKEKFLEDFSKDATKNNGLTYECKVCRNEVRKTSERKKVFDGVTVDFNSIQKCSKCKTDKLKSEFSKDKYNINGITSQCKTCRASNGENNRKQNYIENSVTNIEIYTKLTGQLFECPSCHASLSADNYQIDRYKKNGLFIYCKTCSYEKEKNSKSQQERRKETGLARSKQSEFLFSGYRRGAIDRGHTFEITYNDFMKYWQKPCQYCGSDIDTIGLDRVDNSEGYLIDNIVTCCFPCNQQKSTLSFKDWITHIHKIYNFLKLEA